MAGATGSIHGQAGAGLHGYTGTEALGFNYGQAGAGLHIPIHDRSKGLQPKVKPELFHTHNQGRSKGLHPRPSWNNSTFLSTAGAMGSTHGLAGAKFHMDYSGRSKGLQPWPSRKRFPQFIPRPEHWASFKVNTQRKVMLEKVSTILTKMGATGSTSKQPELKQGFTRRPTGGHTAGLRWCTNQSHTWLYTSTQVTLKQGFTTRPTGGQTDG